MVRLRGIFIKDGIKLEDGEMVVKFLDGLMDGMDGS